MDSVFHSARRLRGWSDQDCARDFDAQPQRPTIGLFWFKSQHRPRDSRMNKNAHTRITRERILNVRTCREFTRKERANVRERDGAMQRRGFVSISPTSCPELLRAHVRTLGRVRKGNAECAPTRLQRARQDVYAVDVQRAWHDAQRGAFTNAHTKENGRAFALPFHNRYCIG